MSFTEQIPWGALVGGLLIGLGLAGMLVGGGRIAGVSGTLDAALTSVRDRRAPWQTLFLCGMLVGGAAFAAIRPEAFDASHRASLPVLAVAGLLVGVGTRLGQGCTSGHGICGVSRFSKRSITATIIFMCTGALSATLLSPLLGVS